jgi:prophage regulatory protein
MELAKSGTNINSSQLLRVKQLIKLLSISKSTIYGWIKDDKFPKGTKINGITVWRESEINDWVSENYKDHILEKLGRN